MRSNSQQQNLQDSVALSIGPERVPHNQGGWIMVSDTNLTDEWADKESNNVKPNLKGLMIIVIVFGLLLITSLITLAQSDYQIPIRTERLSENVIFFNTGESSALTNVVAISTDDGVVVIDTSPTLDTARRIRSSIEEAFGQKVFPYVIFTHAAFDHTIGVKAFEGSVTIGHERGLKEIEQVNSLFIRSRRG